MIIRQATISDIPGLLNLLFEADAVHSRLRPDLFKSDTSKYSEQELTAILSDKNKVVFVYEDNGILGHVFCQIIESKNDRLLQDRKTLYIDDLCVEKQMRGKHIGRQLFDFVRNYAISICCDAITLNVWEGNSSAMAFYKNMGMQVQKIGMEMQL